MEVTGIGVRYALTAPARAAALSPASAGRGLVDRHDDFRPLPEDVRSEFGDSCDGTERFLNDGRAGLDVGK